MTATLVWADVADVGTGGHGRVAEREIVGAAAGKLEQDRAAATAPRLTNEAWGEEFRSRDVRWWYRIRGVARTRMWTQLLTDNTGCFSDDTCAFPATGDFHTQRVSAQLGCRRYMGRPFLLECPRLR